MSMLSRRSLLAASAAALAARGSRAAPTSNAEVDVAIVGAGAAGVAAARRIAAAGRRVVVIEAADRIGGRCLTDTATFGVPVDRGAHWIHVPDLNPLMRLAPQTGLEIAPAPPGQKMRIGPRNAREGEMEDYLAALVRATRAIGEAARKADVSCTQALPKDLGDWRASIEFTLGPYGCSKDLGEVSAMDLARSVERDADAFCRQGLGTLIAKLAAGLPVQRGAPVTAIDLNGRAGVEIATARGHVSARGIIVTVSTGVLLASKIKFIPELPRRQLDAASKLALGSYDRVILELPGNPLGLDRDDLVFEQAKDRHTAALLANAGGSPLAMVDVGGSFGRDLAAQGEAAMSAFALDWLAGLYGGDLRKAVKRTSATNWNAEPWVLGASSAAAPGAQPARRILMEPVRDRLWFAGEAAHETLWGTVGGAWESGERAADAAMKRLGLTAEPRPPQRTRQRR
ncbi:MAG TPA: NAD(P)/FAD-dependent oxidoreductase [Xanthobacteraceae bacterium]|nr:NAD(P)/FAD-dependent oxidoreductase [Xanthobacteraceae bacterium]